MAGEDRKTVIRWCNDRRGSAWWAITPGGRHRRFDHRRELSFLTWVISFLKHDGDIVEVRYPKTVTTYKMTTRKRLPSDD